MHIYRGCAVRTQKNHINYNCVPIDEILPSLISALRPEKKRLAGADIHYSVRFIQILVIIIV